MKIVFLDIDGVLNTMKNYQAHRKACEEDPDGPVASLYNKHAHLLFDRELVANLNRITDATKARIVVSSSWRKSYNGNPPFAELRGLFKKVGITADVIGKTPTNLTKSKMSMRVTRGDEIEAWLMSCRGRLVVESYVILDDDSDMLDTQQASFVKVIGWMGLMPEDAERAVQILGAKSGE